MTLPHTEVDPSVGGRGIGTALVAGVLDAARERGLHRAPLLLLHPALHPAAPRATWISSRPTTAPHFGLETAAR